MRRDFSMVIAVTGLLFSAGVIAQTPRDALRAFAKLEARIEIGISYRDYSAMLGDVNFEVKAYLDGPESAAQPAVKAALARAMLRHLEAKQLWSLTFGRYGTKSLESTSDLGKALLERYPEAAKPLKEGGATFLGGALSIEFLLPFLWRDASESIRAAGGSS